MALRVVTAPAVEPVTLEEAKLHARVDGSDEDTLLALLVSAVRAHGEAITQRVFVTQTLELTLPAFPSSGGPIELPRPPFQSIVSVKYYAPDGTLITMPALDYFALASSDSVPAKLYPTPDDVWPETQTRANAVTVQYIAGWPVEAGLATTPQALKAWMLVRITDLYTNREKYVTGTGKDTLVTLDRNFVDALLDQYTVLNAV